MFIFSRTLMIGFGCIGQALLPFLQKREDIQQISIITADEEGLHIASACKTHVHLIEITQENHADVLSRFLKPGDLLVNVSVNVSSLALIKWCQQHAVYYVDTCIEPWEGGYTANLPQESSNYILRHKALSTPQPRNTTAIVAHGANPGLVSHFVKQGLTNLAEIKGIKLSGSWAQLAQQLDIRVIQIAERDTQHGPIELSASEFSNTWSVDGFMAEAWQLAELGWGSHERRHTEDIFQHAIGDESAVYMNKHSAQTKVKTWTPSGGEQAAWLITHHESISIASLLSLSKEAKIEYRPTVYYAYQPAPMAKSSLEQWIKNGYTAPSHTTVLKDSLTSGFDELGVLFIFPGGCYWYGSKLNLTEARTLAPYNNATSLQVVAGIISAIDWMTKNPDSGIVEAEAMQPYHEILASAMPLLGEVHGVMSTWQPNNNKQLQLSDFLIS